MFLISSEAASYYYQGVISPTRWTTYIIKYWIIVYGVIPLIIIIIVIVHYMI